MKCELDLYDKWSGQRLRQSFKRFFVGQHGASFVKARYTQGLCIGKLVSTEITCLV